MERLYMFPQTSWVIFFKIIYLFILKERGREEKRDGEKHWCARETSIGCLSHIPQLGTWPTTQARALTGNGTCQRSVHRATPALAARVDFDFWMCWFKLHVQNPAQVGCRTSQWGFLKSQQWEPFCGFCSLDRLTISASFPALLFPAFGSLWLEGDEPGERNWNT